MNYKNQPINILILACKRGDQKAQMELYPRFNQSLYYSAYRIVKNGTLTIKQKEKLWFGTWDTEMVYLTVPVEDIDKVILSGYGEIDSRFTLEGDHFKTIVSGSGDINISADVNHPDTMVTGS